MSYMMLLVILLNCCGGRSGMNPLFLRTLWIMKGLLLILASGVCGHLRLRRYLMFVSVTLTPSITLPLHWCYWRLKLRRNLNTPLLSLLVKRILPCCAFLLMGWLVLFSPTIACWFGFVTGETPFRGPYWIDSYLWFCPCESNWLVHSRNQDQMAVLGFWGWHHYWWCDSFNLILC